MKASVLFDGWCIVYQPNSSQALHLLALLDAMPDGYAASLALPGEPPDWLPKDARVLVQVTPDIERQRLVWEQRKLPALANESGADLVHLVGLSPALLTRVPVLISPADYGVEGERASGLYARLRKAFASGGMARAAGVLLPDDLPAPDYPASILRLPSFAPPRFETEIKQMPSELSSLDLPETYVLYHGPGGEAAQRRLLEAWSWAAGSIGDYFPLLILGLGADGNERLLGYLRGYALASSVRILPAISPESIAWLYQHCQVLFHPAEIPPWGGAVRLALGCGKPIVALETPRTDALVGPAAYLVPGQATRDLGAALITLVLEEGLAEELSSKARQRAAAWDASRFRLRLEEVYRDVIAQADRQAASR